MFTFEWEDKQITNILENYYNRIEKNTNDALSQIINRWRIVIVNQQLSGNLGGWTKLESSYEARKEREYPGKPILSRTGRLLQGYMTDMQINPSDSSVTIPYSSDPAVRRRGMVHQLYGVNRKDIGKVKRPIPINYNYDVFFEPAIEEFTRAIRKSLLNE